MRFSAQLLDLRRLRLEQAAHTFDHAVHRLRDTLQLGHVGLIDEQVAPFDERVGLGHSVVERAADAPHARRSEQHRHRAERGQEQQRARTAAPQLIVRVGDMADDLDLAKSAPAVADLGHAGRRFDRQQTREPQRRVLRPGRGFAVEGRCTVGADEFHPAVEPGVGLRGQQQVHQLRIAALLRQRQGDVLRVVAVLHAQLRLQRVARRGQVDPHRAGQRQQQHGRQQQTDLSHQAHRSLLI